MSAHTIEFSSVSSVTETVPHQSFSLAHFIEDIRTGKYAEPIERVRAALARGDDALAEKEKRGLPAVIPSGIFEKRGNDGLRQRSGLICADLDGLGDRLPSYREHIAADKHTLACFVSPSGTGLKVLLRVDLERTHEEGFRAMRQYFLERFGLAVDGACKDVGRLCFVSHDPEAYLAENAMVLPYPPEPVAFAAQGEKMPGSRLIEGTRPGDDYDARGDFFGLLRQHGWASQCDNTKRWIRPGKVHGVSATWNEVQGRFYIFSSSKEVAPLKANIAYKPWHVFAFLQHGGDFQAAGRALAEMGFGEQQTRTTNTDRNVGDGLVTSTGTETTAPVPLPLWPPSKFLAHQEDPGAYLLGDGYLERGEWTSLVGIGGLGKTRVALWLSICLITGREWLELKPGPKPPRVLFLSSENGIRRWKKDLSKMTAALTQEERATVETNLLILALTPDAECDLRPTDEDSKSRMTAALQEAKPDLLILDPLADMIEGDESKTPDMIATLRALREVQRRGCREAAVLIIHHSRSGADNVAIAGDRYNAGAFGRGSKAFYSRVRCELQLAPGDKDNGNLLVLACGKANNTIPFTARGIVFDPETFTYSVDPNFDLEAWRSNVHGKRKETAVSVADVVNAVRELAPEIGAQTTRKAVCDHLKGSGCSLRTVQDRIKTALKTGFLREGKTRYDIRLGTKPMSQLSQLAQVSRSG